MKPRSSDPCPPKLLAKLRALRLVAFDVDGTLTDGRVYLGAREELKAFDIRDGLGLRLLIEAGIEIAFITGRKSAAVARRAAELGVRHVFQGEVDKAATLQRLMKRLGVSSAETAAMGDDLPDLHLFAVAGVRLAVADAAAEVRAAADWVSTRPGGRGAAREAAELILKAQGRWEAALARWAGPPAVAPPTRTPPNPRRRSAR